MLRFGAETRRVDGDHDRIDCVDPLDGRSALFHLFHPMRINDTERKFTGSHELSDECMSFAPLNLLLRQSAHVFLRALATPCFVQGAEPGILFLIDGELAFPLGLEEILPLFRRLLFAEYLGVVADARIIDINCRPVAIGIFELGNEAFRLRRTVGREQLSLNQCIDLADRYDIELRASRPRFSDDSIECFSPLARKISPLMKGYC